MSDSSRVRVSSAALLILTLVGAATSARAELADYEFQLTQSEVKQGQNVTLEIKLVHKPTSKPVPNAVIFARRLDMAPDGMATMKVALEQLPSTEPGLYRFRANLGMEGNWRLSLAAKVQGELGTIQSQHVLKAVE